MIKFGKLCIGKQDNPLEEDVKKYYNFWQDTLKSQEYYRHQLLIYCNEIQKLNSAMLKKNRKIKRLQERCK